MKVVLDTNSLLVSIGRHSQYRPIFDSIISGRTTLLVSNDIISEYEEILSDRTTPSIASNLISFFRRSPDVELIQPYFKWSLIAKDADDNKFVDCALNGGADFLVTDDRHFKVLKEVGFPPVKVIRTDELLPMIT